MALAEMKADPWFHAKKNDRNYITPEDVTAAIWAGAREVLLLRTVLWAIVDTKAEDHKLCAFVALKMYAVPKKKRATPRQGVPK